MKGKVIGTDATIATSYLFTSNLRELSGAVLHKTVFAFRLAYIIEIERAIGIKLPIIMDSPSGKEIDQENIKLMMDILKRDFSDQQIIIASIFDYEFNPLNRIEIVNRLIENEAGLDAQYHQPERDRGSGDGDVGIGDAG